MEAVTQSPTDSAFVQDPYPFYDRARAMGEIVWWEDHGLPCALSQPAVSALLRHRSLGRAAPPDRAAATPPRTAAFDAVEAHSLLELEPPDHTRLRGLVLRAFTSRRIAALGPEIEALCHRLVDRLPVGAVDLIPAYAARVPVTVIARLLGVPEAHCDQLLAWSSAMVAMYQARRDGTVEATAARAAAEFSAFLGEHIEERRRRPGDDLITELIAAEDEGRTLSRDEMISTCILLLNAGHEATVHALGTAAKTLIEHGRAADFLTPHKAPASVEELLRLDPPLHLFTRWVYEKVEIAGHRFAPGDRIACLLGAACRDPHAYPDPGRFDPTRGGPAHPAFGAGIHFCLGAPLARLEMQIALRVLFERLPDPRLAAPPRYADIYHFRGLEALMVRPG